MHVKSAHLEFGIFADNFDFDERVNVFIGPNGSGKTTILRGLERFYSLAVKADGPFTAFDFMDRMQGNAVELYPSDDWTRDSLDSDWILWNHVPLLYVPAVRTGLPLQSLVDRSISDSEEKGSENPLEDLFDTASGIFRGYLVKQAIEWLLRPQILSQPPAANLTPMEYRERLQKERSQHQKRQGPLRSALRVGLLCAQGVCPEVIMGNTPQTYVEDSPTGRTLHRGMAVSTSDDFLSPPQYVGALSSGTQGTLLWIWALALRMVSRYDWANDWQEKPAILLIDEIENHLHPTWQRRVIPALLDHFPGLQIFATTHSPFVVAGLKAGQVHLLNRDGNGVVTATTNTEDIIGWTADQILRTMMGVDEPTDQATADRLNRLRQLREKETLTPEEESELNELRRRENADLLSKGDSPLLSENDPLLKAQRERYSDLMQSFLLSRQSDLSQDGA